MKKLNHSKRIKKLWEEGRYDHRDESYRSDKNYKSKVSSAVKKLWEDGVFGEERNQKISNALKGREPWNKGKKKDYKHICKVCEKTFITKTQHRSICNKKSCQSKKGSLRKISKKNEQRRREKISKALKGKMPKNLKANILLKDSPPQRKIYKIIKQYFPEAKYDHHVKTEKSHRWLDIVIPSLKIDIEYNGKCHLLKSVQENDKRRTKELRKLGWEIIIIDRNNVDTIEEICKKIIDENGDV